MSKGKYVYIAKMDIPPEHETLFNHLYDNEHFPAFRKVPGVLDLERFTLIETKNEGLPKYAAIYSLRVTRGDQNAGMAFSGGYRRMGS